MSSKLIQAADKFYRLCKRAATVNESGSATIPATTQQPSAVSELANVYKTLPKEKVQLMQKRLNEMGFTDADGNELSLDGVIGYSTTSAIAAYKKALKAAQMPVPMSGDDVYFSIFQNYQYYKNQNGALVRK